MPDQPIAEAAEENAEIETEETLASESQLTESEIAWLREQMKHPSERVTTSEEAVQIQPGGTLILETSPVQPPETETPETPIATVKTLVKSQRGKRKAKRAARILKLYK